ncbi:MAG: site-2 protease family protein [Clostridia bacterium]|nr:site-2 protease family protein [Clostridia bacterium]
MFTTEYLSSIILSALAVLLILPIHEFAHGLCAYALGDPTAKNSGRLTLNPIKHLDLFGSLCLVLFHFGWAKPVPVNARYFKKPKRDFALVALAGPVVNLLVAFLCVPILLLLPQLYVSTYVAGSFLTKFIYTVYLFMSIFLSVNIGLAIFNLLPIPPLDGSRILCAFLPPKAVHWLLRNERNIYIAMIAWLLLGDVVSSALLSVPFVASNPALSFVASLFSLTDWLAKLNILLSDLMFSFWRLIPALNI